MYLIRKGPLRIAELHIDEEARPRADIVRYRLFSRAVPDSYCQPYRTVLLDLRRSSEELLAEMSSETRYKIRRASTRDDLKYSYWEHASQATLLEFIDDTDAFARSRGIQPVNRDKVQALLRSGQLDISRMAGPDGGTLVWHAHVRTSSRVALLYSASHFRNESESTIRNLIGRANRLLHWLDARRFQDGGAQCYDLGGLYWSEDTVERAQFNRFKREFARETSVGYHCEKGITLTGRLALTIVHRSLPKGDARVQPPP